MKKSSVSNSKGMVLHLPSGFDGDDDRISHITIQLLRQAAVTMRTELEPEPLPEGDLALKCFSLALSRLHQMSGSC